MITKHAEDPERCRRDGAFFASARRAWGHVLRALEPRRILLPAYIGYTDREGSGVLDPVLETRTPFDLYPVDERLWADTASLEERLATGRYDLLLAIHYFGHARCDLSAVRAACVRHGVVLVEDCAHAFQWGLDEESLGTTGDYAFYSIHKHLPTGTGGLLRRRPDARALPPVAPEDAAAREVVEAVARAEFGRIAERRREHAAALVAGLDAVPGVEPLLPGERALVPQTLAVRVADGKREALYFALMERGVQTIALYYRLHDAIRADAHPVPHAVSASILNLPVHQDLEAGDPERLLVALAECAAEVGL